MDPANLKSLIDHYAQTPRMPGSHVPMAEEDLEDEAMAEGADDERVTGAARGEQLIEEWGEFGQTLKDEASELHDLAMDAGPGLLLKTIPDDAMKAVGKAVDGMPDELAMGLAKYVSKLSGEDCLALGEALATAVGEDADSNLLYQFLHEAGKYAAEEVDVDEDFNESEEDEEPDQEDAPESGDAEPEADPY